MARSLAIAVLLALGLVGCGLGAAAPTPTPSPRDRAVAAWRQAIDCAREHGWDAPDPVIDDQGNASFPPTVGKPPEDVINACERYIAALPQQNGSNADGPTADDIRLARQFAACMRQHGEPMWPDPNADGTFPPTPAIEAEGKSDTFLAAMQACAQYHPSGRIWFSHP